MTNTLTKLFERDLNKLKEEIQLYKNESNLWLTSRDISNSAGNLTLHLIGNLNHFIGAALGNTGYIRQRDLEFSQKHMPVAELTTKIDGTMAVVLKALSNLKEENLQAEYKHRVFNKPMTTEYFLMHLATHLAYHLGQINYHRRLLDN